MIYYLSSAQHKQLTDRMGPLRIALPAPQDDPADWLQWARSVISEKHRQYVVDAWPEVITVSPSRGGGLDGVIGSIETRDADFAWGVEAVLCDLDPPMEARHPRSRPQWPARVDTQTASGTWPKERPSAE
jgi:hypothetical protein